MSKENVERVARIFTDEFPALYRWLSGGSEGVAWDPATFEDFVWDTTTFEGWPEPREFHGFEGFVEFLQIWTEPYDDFRIDVEDVIDAGEDRVVAILRQSARLRGSASEVEMTYGVVYEFEAARIRRASAYATAEEALEAVGRSD
jgi:ketosteroid isomerase-like protein